ncbi:MAG: hypothetical protein K2N23_01835 [Clostridia bacterium]|nr:hypothetical protein [Clostridia bacterium]
MKKRFLFIAVLCTLMLTFLSACDIKNAGSLKSITNPYIAQYECVEATLGEEDLLKKYDYIKITLVDKENLEFNYRPKNGENKTLKSKYTFDVESRKLSAEVGILGYTFKQSTIVEKGKFTISKSIGGKQLIMKFKAN